MILTTTKAEGYCLVGDDTQVSRRRKAFHSVTTVSPAPDLL